jgi:tRNA 2-thiouridine synthesizing protein D
MKIAIVVYGSPSGSQAAATAYRYVSAALERGHEIYRVFFYGEGVHTATALAAPPQDETDLFHRWQSLGKAHDLDLVVCIAAALRRGICDPAEARRHEKPASNLAPGFELSGLGQLVDAAIHSDRLITFGG